MSGYVSSELVELLHTYLEDRQIDSLLLHALPAIFNTKCRLDLTDWNRLLNSIQGQHPDHAIGLSLASMVNPRHFGAPGLLFYHSLNLEEALDRFVLFQPLLQNSLQPHVNMDKNGFSIRWIPTDTKAPSEQYQDLIIGGWVNLLKSINGRNTSPPFEVFLPRRISPLKNTYEQHFNCRVTFDSPCIKIRIPSTGLYFKTSQEDRSAHDSLILKSYRALGSSKSTEEFVACLRSCIIIGIQTGAAHVRDVAARMGLSERGLYRKLADRGIKFKNVMRDVRFDLARIHLVDEDLSLTEISMALGYSEPSIFTRAFKLWSGMTPTQYRRMRSRL